MSDNAEAVLLTLIGFVIGGGLMAAFLYWAIVRTTSPFNDLLRKYIDKKEND